MIRSPLFIIQYLVKKNNDFCRSFLKFCVLEKISRFFNIRRCRKRRIAKIKFPALENIVEKASWRVRGKILDSGVNYII